MSNREHQVEPFLASFTKFMDSLLLLYCESEDPELLTKGRLPTKDWFRRNMLGVIRKNGSQRMYCFVAKQRSNKLIYDEFQNLLIRLHQAWACPFVPGENEHTWSQIVVEAKQYLNILRPNLWLESVVPSGLLEAVAEAGVTERLEYTRFPPYRHVWPNARWSMWSEDENSVGVMSSSSGDLALTKKPTSSQQRDFDTLGEVVQTESREGDFPLGQQLLAGHPLAEHPLTQQFSLAQSPPVAHQLPVPHSPPSYSNLPRPLVDSPLPPPQPLTLQQAVNGGHYAADVLSGIVVSPPPPATPARLTKGKPEGWRTSTGGGGSRNRGDIQKTVSQTAAPTTQTTSSPSRAASQNDVSLHRKFFDGLPGRHSCEELWKPQKEDLSGRHTSAADTADDLNRIKLKFGIHPRDGFPMEC